MRRRTRRLTSANISTKLIRKFLLEMNFEAHISKILLFLLLFCVFFLVLKKMWRWTELRVFFFFFFKFFKIDWEHWLWLTLTAFLIITRLEKDFKLDASGFTSDHHTNEVFQNSLLPSILSFFLFTFFLSFFKIKNKTLLFPLQRIHKHVFYKVIAHDQNMLCKGRWMTTITIAKFLCTHSLTGRENIVQCSLMLKWSILTKTKIHWITVRFSVTNK